MIGGCGWAIGCGDAQRLGPAGSARPGTARRRRSTSAGRSAASPPAARTARRPAGTARRGPGAPARTRPRRCPSSARPPESTSSVVTVFASSPGWRYVTPVTSRPSGIRSLRRPGSRASCSPRASARRPADPVDLEEVVHQRKWANPASSAARATSPSVGAIASTPPGQAKLVTWIPTFTLGHPPTGAAARYDTDLSFQGLPMVETGLYPVNARRSTIEKEPLRERWGLEAGPAEDAGQGAHPGDGRPPVLPGRGTGRSASTRSSRSPAWRRCRCTGTSPPRTP